MAWVAVLWATPLRRLMAFISVANLLVYILALLSLYSSYRQYHERAAISSRNTDRLVAQDIGSEIDRIDLALRMVVFEIDRERRAGGGTDARLDEFLSLLQASLPMVLRLRVAAADGQVIHGLDPARKGSINNGDRDYFLALRDDSRVDFAISRPTLARSDGQWVLAFARRLLPSPGGGFGGIVYASVPVDWFIRKFDALEVGKHGVVVMRGDASRDFDLLARYPSDYIVGQTKVSELFRAMIAAAPQTGSYEAAAGADAVYRSFSYHRVGTYPLITLVGLAPQDYMGDWWREAVKMVVLVAAFTLVTLFGGWAMAQAWTALQNRSDDLKRSNADLEQFAYVASHDLQTPLRNIVSYTQLLERRYRGRLDGDADEFIAFIVNGSKQMARLISDLLEYSRISRQAKPLAPIRAAEAVAQALRNLQPDMEQAGAEIVVGELPTVMAEQALLTSLFQNLLGNGLKYRAPDRKLRLSVTAERAVPEGWRFAVADNGIGINPAYHDKIFEMFQRLNPAIATEGSGIGLTLCRRIVHRFGGTIWLQSTPDGGSTFFLTLRDGNAPAA